VYENFVKLHPMYLRNGQQAPLSKITIMAAYANVFGYSWQVVRAVTALNLGRVNVKAQAA
jgi:hypothetical protein